jgi:preprotein translocase SecE subunit
MATAVEPSSKAHAPVTQTGLALAGLAGGVYVLASLAVVFIAVPHLWGTTIGPKVAAAINALTADFLLYAVMVAAAIGLGWLGQTLAGPTPPKGLRGGITLSVSALIAIFFVVRAFGLNLERFGTTGMIVTAAVFAGLAFGTFRLLASARGERWMVGLEDTGLMSTTFYKRALGVKVRRLTILGIIVIGVTGAYALHANGLGAGAWSLSLPFTQVEGAAEGTHQTLTVLTHANDMVFSLLVALAIWVAFRAVNVPVFAEFLIATEAEMNKVSWSTRRRLFQDTMVVLATTVLLTLFLLVVDLFWGWLLSRDMVGVLPGRATDTGGRGQAAQEARW